MTEAVSDPHRRRLWIATLLNVVLSPGGYVYAGSIRAALAFAAYILLVLVAFGADAYLRPWGAILGQARQDVFLGLMVASVLVSACHAAVLTTRPAQRASSGWRLWAAVLGAGLGLLIAINLFVFLSVMAIDAILGPVSVPAFGVEP